MVRRVRPFSRRSAGTWVYWNPEGVVAVNVKRQRRETPSRNTEEDRMIDAIDASIKGVPCLNTECSNLVFPESNRARIGLCCSRHCTYVVNGKAYWRKNSERIKKRRASHADLNKNLLI